jgi:hypothetical protein
MALMVESLVRTHPDGKQPGSWACDLVLRSALLVLSGCNHALMPASHGAGSEGFEAFSCPPSTEEPSTSLHLVERLKLRTSAPYVSVRRVTVDSIRILVSEKGSPCGDATDRDDCQKRLEMLHRAQMPLSCDAPPCPGEFYATTADGDSIRLWRKPQEMTDLLGSIDTPEEAWLLAQATTSIGPYACGDSEFSAFRIRKDGAIELRQKTMTRACDPLQYSEARYIVAKSGRISSAGSPITSSDPATCSTGDDAKEDPSEPAAL